LSCAIPDSLLLCSASFLESTQGRSSWIPPSSFSFSLSRAQIAAAYTRRQTKRCTSSSHRRLRSAFASRSSTREKPLRSTSKYLVEDITSTSQAA
jgi:hypothetical protein